MENSNWKRRRPCQDRVSLHFDPISSLLRIAKLNRIERIRFSSQSFSVPWLMHGTRMAGDGLCKAAVKMFSKCFSNCSMDERFLQSLKLFLLIPPFLPSSHETEPHANSMFVPKPRFANFTQHEFFAFEQFTFTSDLVIRHIRITKFPRSLLNRRVLSSPLLCVISTNISTTSNIFIEHSSMR